VKTIARYAVNFGLEGCYTPESYSGPFKCDTRRDLAKFIREQLNLHDLPKSLFSEVHITRLWSFIKRHGSSTAHFTLYHRGMAFRFVGLTEEEFENEISELS